MEDDAPDREIDTSEKPSDPRHPSYTSPGMAQTGSTFTVACGCPVIGVATVEVSSGWIHTQEGHAEVSKDHLIDAISNPVAVLTDKTRPVGTGYVFQGNGKARPDSKSKIHVFVKVVSGSKMALLSTAFYMRKPSQGQIVWTRGSDIEKEE